MRRFSVSLGLILLFSGVCWAQAEPLPVERLKTHVEKVANPAHKGRRTGSPGAAFAATWIGDRFKEIGLEPGGDEGGFLQKFEASHEEPGGETETLPATNVVGLLPGQNADRFIVVGAHFDTPGKLPDGTIAHGADGNASGVAVLLELARRLKPADLHTSVAFVALDANELTPRYQGAAHFIEAFGKDRIQTYLNLDIVGNDLYPDYKSPLIVLGTEHSPELRAATKTDAVETMHGSVFLIERTQPRSDYAPFRKAGVPFVFFTTGPTRHYHTETDRPDTLDYEKMARIGGYVAQVIRRVAGPEVSPSWVAEPEPMVRDVKGVLRLLNDFLERKDDFDLSEDTLDAMLARKRRVKRMLKRGRIRRSDKRYLQKTLETLLFLTTGIEAG